MSNQTQNQKAVANALYIVAQTSNPVDFTCDLADTVVAGVAVAESYAQKQYPDRVDAIVATTIQLILATIFEAYPADTKQALVQMLEDTAQ